MAKIILVMMYNNDFRMKRKLRQYKYIAVIPVRNNSFVVSRMHAPFFEKKHIDINATSRIFNWEL